MEDPIYTKYLKDLITITPHKKVEKIAGKPKKVISTCLFIPENPSIDYKTPSYITGLMKNIEHFHKTEFNDSWNFRIYFDEMYLTGITEKQIKEVASNDVEYQYNKIPEINNSNNSYTKNTKTKIHHPKNKLFLKKILRLVNEYIKHILTSEEVKYQNIEIYTFSCPSIKQQPYFLGHPSTFGSIMRFMPMFDNDVDVLFTVNSRYEIYNNVFKMIIMTWGNDDKSHIFNYVYKPGFTKTCLADNILQHFRTPNPEHNQLFKEAINSILQLKQSSFKTSYTETYDDITAYVNKKSNSLNTLLKGLINTGLNNFDSEVTGIAGGVFGIKKQCILYNERKLAFAQLLQYYIVTNNSFDYCIDELFLKIIIAFEAGTHFHTLNHTIYYHQLKTEKITKEINEVAQTKKISISDAILEWTQTIGIDLSTMSKDKLTIDFINKLTSNKLKNIKNKYTTSHLNTINNKLNSYGELSIDYTTVIFDSNYIHLNSGINCPDIDNFLSKKDKIYPLITNSSGNPLQLTFDYTKHVNIKYHYFNECNNIQLFNSRSLLEDLDGTRLTKDTDININICNSNDNINRLDIDLSTLFCIFDEYKKLILIDYSIDNFLNRLLDRIYPDENPEDTFFTVIDLKDYQLFGDNNIKTLLMKLIEYYQTNIESEKQILKIIKPIEYESNSNSQFNNNSNNENQTSTKGGGSKKQKKAKNKKTNKKTNKKINKKIKQFRKTKNKTKNILK